MDTHDPRTTSGGPPEGRSLGRRAEIRAAVDARLEAAFDTLEDGAPAHEDLTPLFDELRRLTRAGGKRLRPAFLYWGYAAGDGSDPEAAVDAGAALEMLHLFAIVHDDIMDASPIRRGEAASHVAMAELHEKQDWPGDPARFGASAAMLVGDFAFVLADRLLAGARFPAAARDDAFREYTEMRFEVLYGQQLDLLEGQRREADEDTARRIATLKTAKYTVERPLRIGAALAGAGEDVRGALSAYGVPVGTAFQLRDDLLGAFGDSDVTGKPVGDDFREAKQTYLLARARARGDAAHVAVVDSLLGRDDLSTYDVAELRAAVRATGAVTDTEALIADLLVQGLAALEEAGDVLPGDVRAALAELAGDAAYRGA